MCLAEVGEKFWRIDHYLLVGGADVLAELGTARDTETVAGYRGDIRVVGRGKHGQRVHTYLYATLPRLVGKCLNLGCSLRKAARMEVEVSPALEDIADMYQVETTGIGIIESLVRRSTFVEHIGRIGQLALLDPLAVLHRVRQSFCYLYLSYRLHGAAIRHSKKGDGGANEVAV